MDLGPLDTLLVILFFGIPGFIFLYAYSCAFSPIQRVYIIRQQFPFELTFFYLAASAGIHLILLTLFLIVLNLMAIMLQEPHLLASLLYPFLDVTRADVCSITTSVFVAMLYFIASALIAYSAGRWWGKHYDPTPFVPLWCKKLAELRALSSEDSALQAKLLLSNGREWEGVWEDFRLLGGEQSAFEITIRQPKKNQTICVNSKDIVEMTVTCKGEKRKFIFQPQKEAVNYEVETTTTSN